MLSKRYLTALEKHCAADPPADFQSAHKIGSQAVSLGIETLDLAKIHREALAGMVLGVQAPRDADDLTWKAGAFFTEAVSLIERTHRMSRQARADLEKLNATLAQQTLDVAESRREVREGVARRLAATASLKCSEALSARLLDEARKLDESLQELAHRTITAQEGERKKLSHTLQDEVAQTLLGIQVRLEALKKELSTSSEDFEKEIEITQGVVRDSVKTIDRFLRESGSPS